MEKLKKIYKILMACKTYIPILITSITELFKQIIEAYSDKNEQINITMKNLISKE
ncbi:hypothetical protein [Sigmofec virus UA08Rod_6044]|uniref:Uncharacterized protein n=1 Tax=Sigmofec virus UA08Rod_6044 TaxID=2929448 RepID=A0A976R7X5_9VIRU|nr:hypothetical protein [Sigmofec virus UA08Rod_6044]